MGGRTRNARAPTGNCHPHSYPQDRSPSDKRADQYVNSRTHASRLETGPSYSDDFANPMSGGIGGSIGAMSASSRSTGTASTSTNSRQNPSPYSNDGAYTYQPPPPNDHSPTSGAGVGFGGSSNYGPSSVQPRSAGLNSTSNPSYGSTSGGGYGGNSNPGPYGGMTSSSGGFGGSSVPNAYGSGQPNAYVPPPSTAPPHGYKILPASFVASLC